MKIIKKSFKKPDDPIYKEGFKTFTSKKSTKKKDKVEAEYDKTLPSCETERFAESLYFLKVYEGKSIYLSSYLG